MQRFLSGKPVGPEIKVPLATFKSVLHGWYLELIRERSEAKWPEFGGKRLERWHSSQGCSVIAFRSEMDYRNAVLYLPVFAAAVSVARLGSQMRLRMASRRFSSCARSAISIRSGSTRSINIAC